jgi:hypothetical protein
MTKSAVYGVSYEQQRDSTVLIFKALAYSAPAYEISKQNRTVRSGPKPCMTSMSKIKYETVDRLAWSELTYDVSGNLQRLWSHMIAAR